MPIKMIATRRHFHRVDGRDVVEGEPFEVEDEKEAKRLELRSKATRAKPEESAPAPVPVKASPKPVMQTRVMRAETATPPTEETSQPAAGEAEQSKRGVRTAIEPTTTDDNSPVEHDARARSSRYDRRDLRSKED